MTTLPSTEEIAALVVWLNSLGPYEGITFDGVKKAKSAANALEALTLPLDGELGEIERWLKARESYVLKGSENSVGPDEYEALKRVAALLAAVRQMKAGKRECPSPLQGNISRTVQECIERHECGCNEHGCAAAIWNLEAKLTSFTAAIEAKDKALEPFARVAKYADDGSNEKERIYGCADFAGSDFREITVGDLCRARAALPKKDEAG